MSPTSPMVRFRRVRETATLPRYMTPGSAGMDLSSAETGEVLLRRGARVGVATGLAMELPTGFEAQVRPRSGLAIKHGVTVVNAPGTIDADYRGEIVVLLINLGDADYVIQPGDRVAQLIIAPVCQAVIEEVQALTETSRGAGGFGHTG
jgi:dUTP pyrophosphatase